MKYLLRMKWGEMYGTYYVWKGMKGMKVNELIDSESSSDSFIHPVIVDKLKLRVKESDRIKSMAINLEELGIEVSEHENGIAITGGVMKGGEIECFGDHRVAMSFAAAGNSSKAKILIKDADSIISSFPEFVQKTPLAG